MRPLETCASERSENRSTGVPPSARPRSWYHAARLPKFLLAAWIAFQLVAFGVWVARADIVRVEGDTAWYQVYALDLYQMIAGRTRVPDIPLPTGFDGVTRAFALPWPCPPLYFLQMGASFALLGPTVRAALWTSAPYLVLLLVGVYLLGTKLGDRKTGLLAAFIVGCYPAILGVARTSETYHPLAAILPWLSLVLLATDLFRRRGASVALGVLTGVAVLLKGQVVIFIGVPYAAWAARGIASAVRAGDRRGALRVAVNLATTVGLLLVVSAPWWIPNSGLLFRTFFGHTLARYVSGAATLGSLGLSIEEPTRPWTFAWATRYARVTWIELMPWFTILFLVGAALTIIRRTRGTFLLWLVVVCPYLFFTAMSGWHESRYHFPSFVGMALITAMGLREIPWRAVRIAVLAASAVFWGLLVFPRSVGPDLFPGVVSYLTKGAAGTAVFRNPTRSRHANDAATIEEVIARGPIADNHYIEWLLPRRRGTGTEKLEYIFHLMARRPNWLFAHALPTREGIAPLRGRAFLSRIDTVLLWQDISPGVITRTTRYEIRDGAPCAIGERGEVLPLGRSWEPGSRERVAGMDFLGAVPLTQEPVVIWVFAKPRAAIPAAS